MMLRLATIAVTLLLVAATPTLAQDFVLGVHSGGTHTRQLLRSGYSGFESGSTLGLAGTMTIKPWLALSVEILVVDKGRLPTQPNPHKYFEVPYMLRFSSPWQLAGIRPYASYGAAYAYELSCDTGCANAQRVTTDFSVVSAWGTTFTWNRFELALEQRRTRGQTTMNRLTQFHATNDMRSLLLRLSFVIPGVVPDWL